MRIHTFLIFFFSLLTWTQAAIFYVRTNGSNNNNGLADTASGAWKTVTHAASQVDAGDTVYVREGIYEEIPTLSTSGSNSNYINFVGGAGTVLRGIYVSGASYVRVIGFEFTQTNNSYGTRPIRIVGTINNVQFLDNYIHDMYIGEGESAIYISGSPTYLVIRGNTIYWADKIGGNGNGNAINSPYLTPHHWTVEYNVIQRANDYVNVYGHHHVIRNNALTDTKDEYFARNWAHSDFYQPGSDGANVGTKYQVYEANFNGDNQCMGGPENSPNGHIWLLQDTVNAGDTNILIRGNVGFYTNNGAIGVIGTDKVLAYHNSFFDLNCPSANDNPFIFYGSNPSTGNLFINTIISGVGAARDAIYIDSGSSVAMSANIGHNAGGTESGYVSTADPKYVDPASPARNFRLQQGSPAINAGVAITTVSSNSGSGKTFSVAAGDRFTDGYGIVDGDTITVGGTTTRIVTVNGNALTVADSVSWTKGDGVFWGTDTTPDIGAFPFESKKLSAATMSKSGSSYTVAPTGDARGVWFYVDGIPTTWDSSSPYSATVASGTVTAKAYALYAQAAPVVTATGGPAPTPTPAPTATPAPTPTPPPIPTPTPMPTPTPTIKIEDVEGLQAVLESLQEQVNDKAPAKHSHPIPAGTTGE